MFDMQVGWRRFLLHPFQSALPWCLAAHLCRQRLAAHSGYGLLRPAARRNPVGPAAEAGLDGGEPGRLRTQGLMAM